MSLMRVKALVCAAALLVLSVPLVGAAPAAQADTGGRTVEGNWHPWNPVATNNGDGTYTGSYDESKTPSVTVDRTTSLGDEVVQVSWKNFTPTSNNSQYYDGDGKPTATPTRLSSPVLYGVAVYQCRGTNPTQSPRLSERSDKDAQCYSAQITPDGGEGGFGPNNAIPTVTQNDGSGTVDFHVENATSNDLLRCSATQPCSIVVVPSQGGIQRQTDPSENISGCDDHSSDFFGPPNYDQFDYFADKEYEASPCGWAKRIVVPLSFAPIADNCPDSSVAFTAAGSPALRRGLGQLLAGWCRGGDAVNFDYNATSNEYLARSRFTASTNGLGSSTDVALVTQPADPATAGDKRFVYAPIANDAVAIPYQIDNPRTGRPIDDLRLSARLVAKLLTQSYSPDAWDCTYQRSRDGKPAPYCATRVAGNPHSVFDDPEFQSLNFRGDHPDRASFPAAADSGSQQGNGAFFPTVVSGDTDLTFELTRWVVSDPDARAFLQGRPDESGMRVNSSYLPGRGQQAAGQTLYPTSAFQPLDPGWDAPKARYTGGENIDPRYFQGFQGSWNPISSLPQVAATIVGNRSTASPREGVCDAANQRCKEGDTSDTIPVQFKKAQGEPFGLRGLSAVTDNTDAQAYRFPTAELVTRTGDAVAPTTASMSRALAAMRTNPDKVTQYVDHATVPGNAYPVMLPVYAMVPTCGVSTAKATAIASMLRHVTESQTYGLDPGTLTPGLLALTSSQLKQTSAAAAAVSSRSCATAPRNDTIGGAPARNTGDRGGRGPASDQPVDGGAGSTGGSGGGTAGGGATPGAQTGPVGAPAATSAAPSAAPSSVPARNAGYALDDDPGSLSLLLPLFLALGGAVLLGTPLAWWLAGTPAGRAALTRLRPRR